MILINESPQANEVTSSRLLIQSSVSKLIIGPPEDGPSNHHVLKHINEIAEIIDFDHPEPEALVSSVQQIASNLKAVEEKDEEEFDPYNW